MGSRLPNSLEAAAKKAEKVATKKAEKVAAKKKEDDDAAEEAVVKALKAAVAQHPLGNLKRKHVARVKTVHLGLSTKKYHQ